MKISHTWIEADGAELGWAVFSQKELAGEDWRVPAGWRVYETPDNDAKSKGIYLIRKTK